MWTVRQTDAGEFGGVELHARLATLAAERAERVLALGILARLHLTLVYVYKQDTHVHITHKHTLQ